MIPGRASKNPLNGQIIETAHSALCSSRLMMRNLLTLLARLSSSWRRDADENVFAATRLRSFCPNRRGVDQRTLLRLYHLIHRLCATFAIYNCLIIDFILKQIHILVCFLRIIKEQPHWSLDCDYFLKWNEGRFIRSKPLLSLRPLAAAAFKEIFYSLLFFFFFFFF